MPRIRIPKHLAACLGVMLFVSCSNPAGMCGCSPAMYDAVLYGRVTDAAGAPVSGARVLAQEGLGGCANVHELGGSARTGADGRYRAVLQSLTGPRPGDCVRAFAMPPSGSALRGSDTVAFAVRFAAGKVVDSARVDLVLRAP